MHCIVLCTVLGTVQSLYYALCIVHCIELGTLYCTVLGTVHCTELGTVHYTEVHLALCTALYCS